MFVDFAFFKPQVEPANRLDQPDLRGLWGGHHDSFGLVMHATRAMHVLDKVSSVQ